MKESLKDSGLKFHRGLGDGEIVLQDEDGGLELWFHNQGHASYGIVLAEKEYEFARSITREEIDTRCAAAAKAIARW